EPLPVRPPSLAIAGLTMPRERSSASATRLMSTPACGNALVSAHRTHKKRIAQNYPAPSGITLRLFALWGNSREGPQSNPARGRITVRYRFLTSLGAQPVQKRHQPKHFTEGK